jgi:hypothetical protein
MIKFRKNPFSSEEIILNFVEGETADKTLARALEDCGYGSSDEMLSKFHLVFHGKIIEKELLPFTQVSESSEVLIAPRIERGSGGQLFKQIAIIAIAIVASAFVSPAVGGGIAGALAASAVTVAGVLALNALIPPPGLGGLGGLSGLNSFEGSQMYTIASQQNSARKFGKVPKVYGTHRVFPNVAANPYTEIEADPETGVLVQTFYAIYDFGFGPLDISEIKIGDTFIQDFANAEYRLVDLNKPVVSEGTWDDAMFSTFNLYKGDVEKEILGISVDKNQLDGGPLDDYQVVRNASSNVQGDIQEITLDFQCPQGLIAYGTDGSTTTREITLNIEFSKVGEDVWRPYNNPDYVFDFSGAGGASTDSYTSAMTIRPLVTANYDQIGQPTVTNFPSSFDSFSNVSYPEYTQTITKYGYAAGTTSIIATDDDALVGDTIFRNGIVIGKVQSIAPSIYPGFSEYFLEVPSPVDVVVFEWGTTNPNSGRGVNGIVRSFNITPTQAALTNNKVYRKINSFGGAIIRARNSNPIYATFKFRPREVAQYKVRVTRVNSYSSKTYQIQDKLTWLSIQARFDRTPVITDKRHVFLEIKIRATNQLNGAIQNLSAVAKSVLEVYDDNTQTWSKQITSNPAWVFCDLMTGEINKRAINKSRLHMASIVEWSEFCDEVPTPPPSQTFLAPRFECNFVLDFDTTLQSIINTVTNSSQASLNVIDGKYGVLVDKLKTVPVQVFTPRNSWNFSSTRSYSETPHAIKVKFVDPFKDWNISEAIVYDNGYDVNNATLIDELDSFACTNYEQAWRFGRYMLAQARLRQENISIDVDFEHIVCTRGDLVYFSQDVMKVGGTPARVKSVSGNQITIDDAIETSPGSYGYVARTSSGIITNTLTVIDSDTFDLDGPIPAVGDIVIIGQVGSIVIECLVKSINPNNDMSATITMVEKAPGVYDAESTDTISLYDPALNPNIDPALFAPGPVEDLAVIENTWRVVGNDYQYYVDIDWEVPIGSAYETFEVYVDSGSGYELVGFSKETEFEYIVDPNDLGIEHGFKVVAVSANGNKIPLIEAPEVFATPLEKLTPPSDVLALYIDITNQVISFNWPQVSDPDLKEYLIRYSPVTDGASWEVSIPLLRVDKNSTTATYQGRTGSYFIKAVDFNLNESSVAASALTSIPNLFDLNIIEETNDFPALNGSLDTVEEDGVGLVLRRLAIAGPDANNYFPEGYYYYENFLDLGEIYTVRLQSLIEAEGFTVADLMSNWALLSDVLALSNAGTAAWDVETQYRGTDSFNVIADWASLDIIDPISEGAQDRWTPWTKFVIGDFTARIFQFRLKLISNIPAVTPRVYDGVIRADMPDRLETYDNQTAGPGGLTVNYSPSFKGPGTSPNIQITQDNAQQGDYYSITGRTLDGFTITFYDKNDVAVTRQFDAMVKGYGRKHTAVI